MRQTEFRSEAPCYVNGARLSDFTSFGVEQRLALDYRQLEAVVIGYLVLIGPIHSSPPYLSGIAKVKSELRDLHQR